MPELCSCILYTPCKAQDVSLEGHHHSQLLGQKKGRSMGWFALISSGSASSLQLCWLLTPRAHCPRVGHWLLVDLVPMTSGDAAAGDLLHCFHLNSLGGKQNKTKHFEHSRICTQQDFENVAARQRHTRSLVGPYGDKW